jgi:hypothetical protein
MSKEQRSQMDAKCQPLRDLLDFGSTKGSEGLWLF